MKRAASLILLSLAVVYLSACASASQPISPAATNTQIAIVSTPASRTVTATPPPTATPTTTTTPSPSVTPGPDFSQARLSGVAHLSDQRVMVSIELSGPVQGAFDGYLGGSYLPCETPYQYPDRIICVGPEPYVNYSPEGALFTLFPLYPEPQAPPLFSARLTIPARATPTATEPVWYPPLPDLPGPPTP